MPNSEELTPKTNANKYPNFTTPTPYQHQAIVQDQDSPPKAKNLYAIEIKPVNYEYPPQQFINNQPGQYVAGVPIYNDIHVQPIVIEPVYLGYRQIPISRRPESLLCQVCQQVVTSRIETRPGFAAWIICTILFVFGFWPCCLIPFCFQDCLDVNHYCPRCETYMGKSQFTVI